jgi:hypothetical protein
LIDLRAGRGSSHQGRGYPVTAKKRQRRRRTEPSLSDSRQQDPGETSHSFQGGEEEPEALCRDRLGLGELSQAFFLCWDYIRIVGGFWGGGRLVGGFTAWSVSAAALYGAVTVCAGDGGSTPVLVVFIASWAVDGLVWWRGKCGCEVFSAVSTLCLGGCLAGNYTEVEGLDACLCHGHYLF